MRSLSLVPGFLALLLTACPGPQPVPTPLGPSADASTVDAPLPIPIFSRKVFDCHQDVVRVSYQGAKAGVGTCLAQAGAPDCLVARAAESSPDVVACLARDLGASANAAVLAGSTDPNVATTAAAARLFIESQVLGFR